MSERIRDRVLDRIAGRAEAEVQVNRTINSLTRFANSFIHQNVSDDATTVELTARVDGRLARAVSTQRSDDDLDLLIERAIAAAKASPPSEDFPGFSPPASVPDLSHHDPATAAASPDDRAEVVRAFVAAGDGLLAAGYCETIDHRTSYGNTSGQRADGMVTRAVVDGIHQTPGSAGKAHQASLRLSDLDGAAAGTAAAGKARASEEPFDLKPGRYEVVLEPNAVGTIAMFLSYYGFNGLAVAEGRSFAELGDSRFDSAFSLRSDPLHPEALALGFDAEGTPAQRTELVTDGTITAHAHDRTTAARMGVESTGHAAGGGSRQYGPMAGNLFIDPGDATHQALVAGVDRGLLVTEFNYCRVLDPKTLAMTGLTRNGTFMIENGVVTGAVTNLRFTQGILEALAPGAVQGIESQVRLADNEFMAGITHVPTMRLAEWNFTGGAGG